MADMLSDKSHNNLKWLICFQMSNILSDCYYPMTTITPSYQPLIPYFLPPNYTFSDIPNEHFSNKSSHTLSDTSSDLFHISIPLQQGVTLTATPIAVGVITVPEGEGGHHQDISAEDLPL